MNLSRFRLTRFVPRVVRAARDAAMAILCLGAVADVPVSAGDSPLAPAIQSVRRDGTNVVVTVYAPDTLRRIVLECRPRMGSGNWVAREIGWPDGKSGEFTFTLPLSRELEMIRVRGDDTEAMPLPASFYQGRNLFDAVRTTGEATKGILLGTAGGSTTPVLDGTTAIPGASEAGPSGAPVRSVVESDIWQVDGRTIYFFNQNRGLQVIDVANPDVPVVRGQLPLAAAGEQMYLLPASGPDGARFAALLIRDGCNWNQGAVVLVKILNGVPTEVGRLRLRAGVMESRLVGDALYLASQDWRAAGPPAGGDPAGSLFPSVYFESVTTIESFDLSNPLAPVAKTAVELKSMPTAISATDRFLMVAVSGSKTPEPGTTLQPWEAAGTHSVVLFDISDPQGHVQQLGSVTTAGQVMDKFKLNVRGDILSVVSQKVGSWSYQWLRDEKGNLVSVDWSRSTWTPPATLLETFSVSKPTAPTKLGSLTIVRDESVYATRFDGDRAYVVTFRQVDPLWIIDLSTPAAPRIAGSLQVPGWSTYLEPMGDRLLAMGQETWGQPTVSLYDVADPAQPRMIERVSLGKWAWSEATQDEKAFKVLPDAGMLLVPWSGQREGAGAGNGDYFSGMQILDFDRDSLRRRGVIDHRFQARRATLVDQRIVSISGTELIAADAVDRDHPVVRATLELAPATDWVFVDGDDLIEVANALVGRGTQVRRASKAAPDTPLSSVTLAAVPIVGLEFKGGLLYVVQKEFDRYRQEARLQTNESVTSIPQKPLIGFLTNAVVELVPQPPKVVGSNQVELVIPLPPLPDGTGQRYVTNLVWRPVLEEQPPLSVTNWIVKTIEVQQPPLLVTNRLVMTNIVSIREPGDGVLSVVRVSKGAPMAVVATNRFAFASEYYGGKLEAFWPKPGYLVWAPGGQENYRYPYFVGDIGLVELMPSAVADATRPVASGAMAMPCLGCFWGPYYGGSVPGELITFDVRDAALPQLVHRLALGESTTTWSGQSPVRQVGDRLLFSHSETRYIPPTEQYLTVTNRDGTTWLQWQAGTYEISHHLGVVDFANPLVPALSPAMSFPGVLSGVSHGGALLYSQVSGTNGTSIAALAFDGASAFLVDSLPLPQVWPQPSRVLADGRLLLGRASTTNTEPSKLESWSLRSDGRFHLDVAAPTPGPVTSVQDYSDLLVASTATGEVVLYDLTTPILGQPLGVTQLGCTYWFDFSVSTGSAAEGLWIPRGYQGVWHLPVGGP